MTSHGAESNSCSSDINAVHGCAYTLCVCLFVPRAFDTLTKALQPEEGCGEEMAEGLVAVRVDEQSTALLELEGPLLSDMHVPFKVRAHCRLRHTAVIAIKK